jgi:hypothetical protein
MLGFGILFVIGGLTISLLLFHENIWSFLGFAVVVVPGGLWYGYRIGGQQWDASQKKRANARNSTSETSSVTSEKQPSAQVIDAEFMEEAIVPCGNCGKKNRLHQRTGHGIYRCGSCRTVLTDPFQSASASSDTGPLYGQRESCGWQQEVSTNGKFSLNGILASSVLQDIVRNDRGPDAYVLFSDYMVRAGFLFEMGAVLGYAFRDRLSIFAQLLASPGNEQRIVALLHGSAEDRLRDCGGKPNDFVEVYFAPEATQLIGAMRDGGLTEARDWLDMHMVASQPIPVSEIFSQLELAPAQGIGFGSRYPDITLELLTSKISEADYAEYQKLRAAGMTGSSVLPQRRPLEQQQEMALSMIRPYVEQARPDLIAALGLSTGTRETQEQCAPSESPAESDALAALRVRVANVIPDRTARDRVIAHHCSKFRGDSEREILERILEEYARRS